MIRENQTICVEDLAVKNMVKNHKLAQAISDVSWGELLRQLGYKAAWYGREILVIDRYFSKTCSACQHKLDELALSVRKWKCPNCGTVHDRDHNAGAGRSPRNTGLWSVVLSQKQREASSIDESMNFDAP